MHIYICLLVKNLHPSANLIKIYSNDLVPNNLSFVLKVSIKKGNAKKNHWEVVEIILNCANLGGFEFGYFRFVMSQAHSLFHYGKQFGPSPGGLLPVLPCASIWFFRDPLTEVITIWYCSPASSLWNVCSETCLGTVWNSIFWFCLNADTV